VIKRKIKKTKEKDNKDFMEELYKEKRRKE